VPLSKELKQAIELASENLVRNPHGELALHYRKKIWASFGPVETAENGPAVRGVGLQRRARLAALSARHVLPVWERAWPADQGPHQTLESVEQYLNGTLEFRIAKERNGRFRTHLDNLISSGKNQDAAYAGFAAFKALSTALFDYELDLEDSKNGPTDGDLEPYDWDASFYASMAYAGCAPWEEASSAARRREFWEWYLKDAVPAA
jgi:hypothetical protein